MIDKGVDAGMPYSGPAPDLGAFESDNSTSTCIRKPVGVSPAFSDGGFAFKVPQSFGTPADNSAAHGRSVLRVFENGVELGPAHAVHVDIRKLGRGRFSHWSLDNGAGESLRLAASDNTDPRTNGKNYTYCVPGR